MARRKGFMAAMNQMAREYERQQQQAQRELVKQQKALEREHARLQREEERAAKAYAAEDAKRRKQLREEARTKEVEVLNNELLMTYEDIDGLLAATLEVDDHIDLESLRINSVSHPEFVSKHQTPSSEPSRLVYPDEPVFQEPRVPRGFFGFEKKSEHQVLIQEAKAQHAHDVKEWRKECKRLYDAELEAIQQREKERKAKLDADRVLYDDECKTREQEAQQFNQELDDLINGLAFDVPEAIENYVSLVLSNSVYPEVFPVQHSHSFDLGTRELELVVQLPPPAEMPSIKQYRYVKTRDEITSSELSQKAQKDRYASAVAQVVVRTLHEVFEADRQGRIQVIAATAVVTAINPATGVTEDIPLAQAAANREEFLSFDLSQVDPAETVRHLGGVLSKKPFELMPADTGGVRKGGTT